MQQNFMTEGVERLDTNYMGGFEGEDDLSFSMNQTLTDFTNQEIANDFQMVNNTRPSSSRPQQPKGSSTVTKQPIPNTKLATQRVGTGMSNSKAPISARGDRAGTA